MASGRAGQGPWRGGGPAPDAGMTSAVEPGQRGTRLWAAAVPRALGR
jgi:hypothetical protein